VIRQFQVAGRGGVPSSGVSAVVLDVSSPSTAGQSEIALWAAGSAAPLTTNLVSDTGPESNLAVVEVDQTGRLSVVSRQFVTDLVVDVVGYMDSSTSNQGFSPMAQTRALDTRTGLGAPQKKVAKGGTLTLNFTGLIPPEASTIVINVTTVDATATGTYSLYPASGFSPAANADFGTATAANLIFAPISNGAGRLVLSGASANIVIDIQGYFMPGGGQFASITNRVIDTRLSGGPLASSETRTFDLTAIGASLPPIVGILLSITAINPASGGYISAWGSGDVTPTSSALNFRAHASETNSAVIRVVYPIAPAVSLFNSSAGSTHVVIDVLGVFVAPNQSDVNVKQLRPELNPTPAVLGNESSWLPAGESTVVAVASEMEGVAETESAESSYGISADNLPLLIPDQEDVDAPEFPYDVDPTEYPGEAFGGLTGNEALPLGTTDTFAGSSDAQLFPATQVNQWDRSFTQGVQEQLNDLPMNQFDSVLEQNASAAKHLPTPEECKQSEAARADTGWIYNHFYWCHSSYNAAGVVSYPYNCATRWRTTTQAYGSNTQRRVHIKVTITGISKEGGCAPPSLKVAMKCNSGYGACNSSNSAKTRSFEQWENDPSFSFDVTSPASGLGDQKFAWARFRLHLTAYGQSGVAREFDDGTLAWRCDSSSAFPAKYRNGCIFYQTRAFLTYRLSGHSPMAARHIRDALTFPASTDPMWPGKTIPGGYMNAARSFLHHRKKSESEQQRVRRIVRNVCKKEGGPNYAANGRECDEYPFNSTDESAGKRDRRFSARAIDGSDNNRAGADLKAFYRLDRIANGDPFQVRIVS
jgi:hypothetical protein